MHQRPASPSSVPETPCGSPRTPFRAAATRALHPEAVSSALNFFSPGASPASSPPSTPSPKRLHLQHSDLSPAAAEFMPRRPPPPSPPLSPPPSPPHTPEPPDMVARPNARYRKPLSLEQLEHERQQRALVGGVWSAPIKTLLRRGELEPPDVSVGRVPIVARATYRERGDLQRIRQTQRWELIDPLLLEVSAFVLGPAC